VVVVCVTLHAIRPLVVRMGHAETGFVAVIGHSVQEIAWNDKREDPCFDMACYS